MVIVGYPKRVELSKSNVHKTPTPIEDRVSFSGPTEKTYMSTDEGYTPKTKAFRLTESLKVIETRGIWEVKDQFMAGPFLNHIIAHRNNSEEFYILEGFVYICKHECNKEN